MAFMVHHLKVDDFDDFKSLFDSDPVGRKQAAKGHLMLRSLDNPNEVFTRVEFDSSRTRRRSEIVSSPLARSVGRPC